jgi:hypothetical protein
MQLFVDTVRGSTRCTASPTEASLATWALSIDRAYYAKANPQLIACALINHVHTSRTTFYHSQGDQADMSAPNNFMRLLHLVQAALSTYGLYNSYLAITNLQTYEETTKRLAKYSDEVGKQLQQTRTTQATGALAVRYHAVYRIEKAVQATNIQQILLSTLTSTALTFITSSLPSWMLFGSSPLLILTLVFARRYVKSYWAPSDGKNVGIRIPLPKAGDYNRAEQATEQLLQVLQWLEWSWVGTAFAGGVVGYGLGRGA